MCKNFTIDNKKLNEVIDQLIALRYSDLEKTPGSVLDSELRKNEKSWRVMEGRLPYLPYTATFRPPKNKFHNVGSSSMA